MGTRERREREKEALREEILDAARKLFVTEGYENVSMRKIAEKIEYSPTTIYLYFKDKGEILHQICEQTFAKLAKSMARIQEGVADPIEGLREGCRTYIQFGLRHPHHYRLTFMVPTGVADANDEYGYEGSMGEQAFNFLVHNVAACVEQKKFRPVDVAAASQVIWAAIHGLTSLLITDTFDDFPWVERKKLIDLTIDTLIRGLTP